MDSLKMTLKVLHDFSFCVQTNINCKLFLHFVLLLLLCLMNFPASNYIKYANKITQLKFIEIGLLYKSI